MNRLSILTVYIFVLFSNTAFAQHDLRIAEANATKKDSRLFSIKTLEGTNTNVKIVPDYVNRILNITCLKDTINITDFWGVPPEIHLLNKNFIEIRYAVRGGSNLGLGNILILCVTGSKLYEAMHTLRYSYWESGNRKSTYHLKLLLKGKSKSNYKLTVSIHDDVISKQSPETNYTYNNQSVLSFDTKQNVFYSEKEDVYKYLIISKKGKLAQQKNNGNFPVIILGKEKYYCINNRWYQLGSSNEMSEVY